MAAVCYNKSNWRGGRVVEGARLEIVYAATYRGFESRPLRQAGLLPLEVVGGFFSSMVVNSETSSLHPLRKNPPDNPHDV